MTAHALDLMLSMAHRCNQLSWTTPTRSSPGPRTTTR